MKKSLETQTGNLSIQDAEVNNSNFKSSKEDNCEDNFNGIDSEYIHYLYRITNRINGKYYYGIHSVLKSLGKDPLYDGYLGSGTEIRLAIQEEGRENFEKEIIEVFETREEARLKEAETVTINLISDPLCYNRVVGGGYSILGKTVVVLKDNPEKILSIDQKEYIEHPEKYLGVNTGYVYVKRKDDSSDSWIRVSKEEYHQNKDKYVTISYGMTPVIDLDENGNPGKETHLVAVEEYRKYRGIKYMFAGYLNLPTKGKVVVFKKDDPDRNAVIMDKTDPRYLSGEYIGVASGLKQSEETIMKKTGEKNGSFGSIWITNGVETKKSYDGVIPDGWRKGRTYKTGTLNKMASSNRKKIESLKISTTVFSKKDNKNIFVKLNRSFFKDRETESELITYEYLIELKKSVKSWVNVAKHLKISRDSLINIIKFYKDLGYSFNSNEPSNP